MIIFTATAETLNLIVLKEEKKTLFLHQLHTFNTPPLVLIKAYVRPQTHRVGLKQSFIIVYLFSKRTICIIKVSRVKNL